MKNNTNLGVIISRFQTDDLHEGHKHLIKEVVNRHQNVLILLGVSGTKLSRKNSLDFDTRKLMVKEYVDTIIGDGGYMILQIKDNPRRNDQWSNNVDEIINLFSENEAFLYGSRESFIGSYEGKNKTVLIDQLPNCESGTDRRNMVAEKPLASRDFRAGCIYTAFNKFPIVYSVVDVAIMNSQRTQLLIGRKTADTEGLYRFIGGFVDVTDESELVTVRREAGEETGGCEVEPQEFICSMLIKDDPRYRGETDQKLMTHFYAATFLYGNPKGSDDLAEVKWFDIETLTEDIFLPEHKPLFIKLKKHLVNNSTLNYR